MTATQNGQARQGEDRPRLQAVPNKPAGDSSVSGADGEVPIGTSDGVVVSERGPARGTRVYACARAAASRVASKVTDRELWLRLARWLWASPDADGATTPGGLFRPPDVWSTDRPSLRRQLAYARWGAQHPTRGLLRAFSVAYAGVGLLVQAGLYFLAWLLERPGRAMAAYALLAVLLHVPAGRHVAVAVARVLIAPLTWLA